MEHLLLSFRVVFPLFVFMSVGYGIKRAALVSNDTVKQINSLIFKVFLPLLNFMNIYHTDLQTSLNPKLMLFCILGLLVVYAIAFPTVCSLEKSNERRGVLIQSFFRSNFILFGLPVTGALYGAHSSGMAAVIAGVSIPLFNILAVFTLERFKSGKANMRKVWRSILTNPLIIFSALGLVFLVLDIRIPSALDDVLTDLAGISTPLALIFLGATFSFSSLRGRQKSLLIGVLARLVAVPALLLPIAALCFGFRNAELTVLMVLFGAPCAVSSYTMVTQIGGDSDLASQLVIITSLGSVFTMFWLIFLLKSLMLI